MAELSLVEHAPTAVHPLCRIMLWLYSMYSVRRLVDNASRSPYSLRMPRILINCVHMVLSSFAVSAVL